MLIQPLRPCILLINYLPPPTQLIPHLPLYLLLYHSPHSYSSNPNNKSMSTISLTQTISTPSSIAKFIKPHQSNESVSHMSSRNLHEETPILNSKGTKAAHKKESSFYFHGEIEKSERISDRIQKGNASWGSISWRWR
eukprot:TRINITY_DN1300_c0_g1_i5.p1 TRINITY_DN1300_c0_g1~~TRINITY_DN1300_c0_g1_i5.p1  ORF type:complete len:138 (-),score=14.10 TRINITY_DN1300_c0_g1_i5:226-639(-)